MAINQDTIHVNGQIWIDKNSPHSMMYHVNGVDYEVQNQARYKIANGNELSVGNIVVLDPARGSSDIVDGMGSSLTTVQRLRKAVFPHDATKILGVITYIGPIVGDYYDVTIASDGFIEVPASAFPQDCESITEGSNTISVIKPQTAGGATYNYTKILGAPVYWFIGRNTGDNNYTFPDAGDTTKGALTLYLPSGKCPALGKEATPGDQYDISYQDLPLIGEVVAYALDSGNTGYKSFRIHLNIQNMYGPISWYWPKQKTHDGQETCDGAALNEGKTIHHGLALKEGFTLETEVIAKNARESRSVMLQCKTYPATDTARGYTAAQAKHANKAGYDSFQVHGKVYYKG